MSPRGQEQNKQMRTKAMATITRAALEVFAEYGYYGATMKNIMQASGLSKGLIYHYFPSKEKIFFHLVGSALEISKKAWTEALNLSGTAWQKIENLSEILYKISFTDDSSLYFLIMVQATTQGKGIPGLMEYIIKRGSHFDLLPPLISKAQQSGDAVQGDPTVLSTTYLALFQGYLLSLFQDKDVIKKITPETFTDVLRNRVK